MKIFLPFAIATLFGNLGQAGAAETIEPDRLVPVPAEIRNSATTPILCQAEIAHWFAMDLATIAPGASASLDLRFDAGSGVWAVVNTAGEALPLERAWCGIKGRTYETRSMLRLDRGKPRPLVLNCKANPSGLDCR